MAAPPATPRRCSRPPTRSRRPRRRGGRGHRAGHPPRARGARGPRGRLPARADPAGAAAAHALGRPRPGARPAARRGHGRPRGGRPGAPRRRRRLRRLRLGAGLPRRPKRRLPIVVHEGNALPGIANRLGARFAPHVATSFPDTPLRHAAYIGLPIRRMISTLDRAALRAEAARDFGLDPDRATLLVTGGSQGARRLNQAVGGAPARRFAAAGVQVLHVVGPKGEVDGDPRPGAAAVRRGALRRPDGPGLRRRRPRRVPRRAPTPSPRSRRSGCPRCSCRCRSATASRSSTPGPSSRPGAACSWPTPHLTPEWVAATVPALATDPARLGGDVGGRRRADPARRRRAAGADGARARGGVGDEGGGPRRAAARRRARPGALRGHRRRRPVRHRPDHAGPRDRGQRQRRPRVPALDALRALGAHVHVGHAAEQVGDADTLVVSTAVRADNPEVVEAQRRGGCGCCRARRRSSR